MARFKFRDFCEFMAPGFCAERPFLVLIFKVLQWVYDEYRQGRARKVAISLPPRAGKSYVGSLFCAWWLGQFPHLSVMRNTCTARLYEKFSRDVRAIVVSEKFQRVFPHVKLHPTNQAVEGWSLTTSTQVGYFGAGVGGTIIGFGAHLAMSDDLYKSFEDASSANQNETVQSWKESAHDSRFEGNCPEIFIGTRWLTRDVIGVALDKGKIDEYVKVPALNENNESFCPAVRTTAQYLETKNDIDEVIWNAEYQQEPADVAGLLFPKSELQFYDPTKISFTAEHKLLYVDPADEGGDNLAAPLGYLVGEDGKWRIYVTQVICNTHGTDENEQRLADLIIDEKVDAMRFESNSGWVSMYKAVRKKVQEKTEDCQMRSIVNLQHKGTRILAQAQWIKNRFIFRSDYESIPEYRTFIKELTSYLRTGGDDQKDGPADALTGMAQYYRAEFRDIF